MTTNDATRAALVDASDLRQVMDDFGFSVNLDFNDEHDDMSHTLLSMTEEVARLRVENARLLAAAPTVQAAAGDDLDAMLDSVHPGCYIDGMKKFGNEWHVWLMWPGLMSEAARGTGPTRKTAVLEAVAKAKESSDADPTS